MTDSAFLKLDGVSYTYPNGARVLRDLSLSIPKGSLFSLLGPNGSGKSTLLGCMFGLLRPQRGSVLLDGRPVSGMDPREAARRMAYVAQHSRCAYAYRVRDYVAMGRTPYLGIFEKPSGEDYALVDETIQAMGVARLADKACTELSGGEKQLVDICRAIVQRPQLLFFDEPTSSLDYGNQLRTLRMIKRLHEEGYTVVMTTHNPDHAIMLKGAVGLLDRAGTLRTGGPDEILTPENLSAVYEAEIHVDYLACAGRKVCVAHSL